MTRLTLISCLALLSASGCGSAPTDTRPSSNTPVVDVPTSDGNHPSLMAEVSAPVEAFAVSMNGTAWYASSGQVLRLDGTSAGAKLPAGKVTFLSAPTDDVLLAHVYGKGLFRIALGDAAWKLADAGLKSQLLSVLNPTARPIPVAAHAAGGVVWLAAGGGLFKSMDAAQTWEPVSIASSGNVNLAFTDVVVSGDTVVAVSMLPESLIPSNYAGLLKGRVFVSQNGGKSFSDGGPTFPSNHATSVALGEDGTVYVGTMDRGVMVENAAGNWTDLGGPTDVVALDVSAGGLTVGSATRGIFRLDGETWTHAGGAPTVAIDQGLAMDIQGRVFSVEPGAGEAPPAPAGGTVHVALSFHGNYSHSYRGDTPTEDGFGQDIRIIRSSLDWLDAYPEVRADWDFDNRTTDEQMPVHSPDILRRIRGRVAAGTDSVRLMSWNNGSMASSTREEFGAAVEWAKVSNTNAFGSHVPGVQPQECMFSPEHVDWYTEHGIDWVTLFYAGNAFTALRSDVTLVGEELYNPATLVNPRTGAEITWIPAYHHADLIDHGGLAGWVRQISAQYAGDSLLVIHFDADSETWEHFDIELASAVKEPNLRWTKLEDYIASHENVARVEIHGDVADGTDDGFRSWAEKNFNHTHFTRVVDARTRAALARFLGDGDSVVSGLVDDALAPRLRTLSTTNFGLSAPYLHDGRYPDANQQTTHAINAAQKALDEAERQHPLAEGELQIVHPRESAGPALLRFEVSVPRSDFTDVERVRIFDGDLELPRRLTHLGDAGERVRIAVELVHEVSAKSLTPLSWRYAATPSTVSAGLASEDAPTLAPLMTPFTDCDGIRSEATLNEGGAPETHLTQLTASRTESFGLPTCGDVGSVRRTLSSYAGLPGTVVDVVAKVGNPEKPLGLQSVVLSPISCLGGATALTWQTFGGAVHTRPAREPVVSWNGQSADGWVKTTCAAGPDWQVAHDTTLRTSMAFAPLHNEGESAFLAPLGTLHSAPAWHEPRRTGGHGYGDMLVPSVAPTFRSPAPDWAGEEVRYRLLVGEGLSPDVLDLFAHPPLVRVGE